MFNNQELCLNDSPASGNQAATSHPGAGWGGWAHLLSSPSPKSSPNRPKTKPKPVLNQNPSSIGTVVTPKSHGPPHPTNNFWPWRSALGKNCWKGKMSQYDPPYPSRWSVGPGGQRDQGHGVVLHDQGEDHQKPITPKNGSMKVS